jgi:hypothetical protein
MPCSNRQARKPVGWVARKQNPTHTPTTWKCWVSRLNPTYIDRLLPIPQDGDYANESIDLDVQLEKIARSRSVP